MKQNSRIKKFLTISSIAAMSLSANFAYAFEPFVIHDIRIEGIQRTEAGHYPAGRAGQWSGYRRCAVAGGLSLRLFWYGPCGVS